MILGDRIHHFRLLKGLTQENVADELLISRVAYSKIERGNSDVTYSRLEAIAVILGVPIWILVGLGEIGYTYLNSNFSIAGTQTEKEQEQFFKVKDLMYELDKAQLKIEALQKELQLKDELIEHYKRNP